MHPISTQVYGDISVFGKCLKLSHITLSGNSGVYGDISVFSTMPQLEIFQFTDTRAANIYGDISSLKNCLNLLGISIQNNLIYGDINAFANNKNIENIRLYQSPNISGSVNSLANCTSLKYLVVNKPRSTITGTSEQTWKNLIFITQTQIQFQAIYLIYVIALN